MKKHFLKICKNNTYVLFLTVLFVFIPFQKTSAQLTNNNTLPTAMYNQKSQDAVKSASQATLDSQIKSGASPNAGGASPNAGGSSDLPVLSTGNSDCDFNKNGNQYCTLAPLGSFLGSKVKINEQGLTDYLNSIFKFGIALSGALAVIMIVIGGLQYLSTDAISGKSDGRKRITDALQGLLLALMAYLILNTINPQILSTQLSLKEVKTNTINDGSTYMPLAAIPGSATGASSSYPFAPSSVSPTGQQISSASLSGASFPNPTWNDAALQFVKASGLTNLTPSDAARYFPNGQVTAEGWVSLLASITKKESNYDPNNVFPEPTLGYNSVGLLQLSAVDARARQFGYSEEDLKDPIKNLQVGVLIMQDQIQKYGVISGQNSRGQWIGGAQYWSTLR